MNVAIIDTGQGLLAIAAMKGGAHNEKFAEQMRAAVADCYDRPGVSKSRQIKLVINVKPVSDAKGNAVDVKIDPVTSQVCIPPFSDEPTVAQITEGNVAVFNTAAPDNPRQGAFEEVK